MNYAILLSRPRLSIPGAVVSPPAVFDTNPWVAAGAFAGASGDSYGVSVSISGDGDHVAIGAPGTGLGSSSSWPPGYVRVFSINGSAWAQRGDDIVGTASGNSTGTRVSISDDGSVVAICEPSSPTARVRVMAWSGSAWVQRGASFTGAVLKEVGSFVSLSGNGLVVAISAEESPLPVDPTNVGGKVSVFAWNGSQWVQRGSAIRGTLDPEQNEFSGTSTAINSDGTIIAIGGPGAKENTGVLRVHQWNGSSWVRRGRDIYGQDLGEYLGYAVAMSSDGGVIAAASPLIQSSFPGRARVFAWNGTVYEQRGAVLYGDSPNDSFGGIYQGLALDATGQKLAVGAIGDDSAGTSSGLVRVFSWSGSAWQRIGDDIKGESAGALTGGSTDLSNSGSRLLVGSVGTNSARVYDLEAGTTPSQASITVTQQPTNQSASGGAATFSATASASNSAPVAYQWERSVDGGVSWLAVAGATSSSLPLSGLTPATNDGDSYRVVMSASSAADTVSSTATLTVAGAKTGSLFSWGESGNGQTGAGATADITVPSQVGSSLWASIACGDGHTLAIRSDGKLFAFGSNSSGQLGDGTTTTRLSPVQIGTSDWTSVACGQSHSLAIRSDGKLFAFGLNSSGRLGDGTTATRLSPVQIGTSDWTSVACGRFHTVAIRSDGKLFAWGLNTYGMVGDGSTTTRTSPVQVGSDDWTVARAGAFHTIAIRSDGALFAWGLNSAGQIGDGTTNTRLSPIQIGSSAWTAVAAGHDHTLGIRGDGVLFSWGSNTQASLGVGVRPTGSTSPQQVSSDLWLSVAASVHSAAIRSDGKLFTWGPSWSGQIGDGIASTNYYIGAPKQVGLAGWSNVAVGSSGNSGFTVALRA